MLPKMCHRSLLPGLGEDEPPPSTTATFKPGISMLQKKLNHILLDLLGRRKGRTLSIYLLFILLDLLAFHLVLLIPLELLLLADQIRHHQVLWI